MSPDSRLAVFKNAIASRYLIDAELGRGGMAVVYAARDVRLARCVAVKVLAPEVVSPVTVAAFGREISHTLRLEHPNILPVLDVGETEGLPFYVMRHVRGGSLRRRLEREHRLVPAEVVGIVRQTAAALACAHGYRILHCDVKPENILLEGEHVYLADFGISRAVRADAVKWGASAAAGGGGGTARYVSPEQALGEHALDGRADLYSLACVAYEMLVGRPPFNGVNDRDIVARRFTRPVVAADEFPRGVPASMRAEIERALSVAPECRQRSVVDFAAALTQSGPRWAWRRGMWRASQASVRGIRRFIGSLATGWARLPSAAHAREP
jgi:serine/threonine-protein kinase